MPKIDERLLSFAKQLRQEMTPAEARLWYRLRAKRLNGVKFVRQSVRRPYIADFVARSHKLIVEIDGDTHAHSESYDERRTAQLEREGCRVIRFTNSDVMTNEEGVLATILAALSPSPLWGEGRGEGAAQSAARACGSPPLPSADCVGSLPLPGGERENKEAPSLLRGEGWGEGQ